MCMNTARRSPLVAAAVCVLLVAANAVGLAQAQDDNARAAQLVQALGLREAESPISQSPQWRTPTRILVVGVPSDRLAWLQAVAPGVELVTARTPQEELAEAARVDAVVGSCAGDLIRAGAGIRWVQTYNAGVERCLTSPVFTERGILLTNMQRVAGPAMAEHVLALMLSFARSLPAYHDAQRRSRWDRTPDGASPAFTLDGKTLLVVGLGGIGTEVARRAHAFGMTVLATRATPRPAPSFVSEVGLAADLTRFAPRADIVVNTLPLTPDTRGQFDARVFATFKRGAYFINVGRGATVVTDDLVSALRSGALAGAGLDVVDPEPLPSAHPLWTMPNVIVTPHSSSDSDVDEESRWLVVRENLRRYVAGERMLSVVDPARGY
jgi:phosphoglycerate dehydrogenase-like enzyme